MRTRASEALQASCEAATSSAARDYVPCSSPPRTLTGKRATVAAVKREHEYRDWLADLPEPARDDEDRDETYNTFMKQRRVRREAERWQERRLQQWEARGAEAPLLTPREQVDIDFESWCAARGWAYAEHNRKMFLKDRKRERERAAFAQGHTRSADLACASMPAVPWG